MMSIGELSRRTGVKVPTIRYYEQTGLIAPAERSAGNQRRYGKDHLARLSFIRHSRQLGLSIEAIRELVEFSATPNMPCERAHRIARAHLDVVSARIVQLQRLQAELVRIAAVSDNGDIGQCQVIEALSGHHLCDGEHVAARPVDTAAW
ncbi:MerR family transcriptional regulator [Hoeflea marina]|uniref:MerR family transcriptional regulator n=1 Tax=Hoeflea marina TaxID=274592 RepID=A0A317PN06_9HYPH|nr:helix-turn-helix domain-containing protein [Hoeflea marina]PWW02147.1 MerR family transcriptional regulator [Hoeflea marina]